MSATGAVRMVIESLGGEGMRIKRISPDSEDPKQLYKEVYVAGNTEIMDDETTTPNDPFDGLTYKNSKGNLYLYAGGEYIIIGGPDVGGGHTIQDSEGQDLPQRRNLRFIGAEVVDSEQGDVTIVQGLEGKTPEISVGTTTTGAPGTDASVVKDPSSTDENVVLNFTIPRGVSGVYYGSSPSNEDSVWIDPTSSSPTKLEVPIGSIVALASESLIDNNSMLLCDGRSVSKSTYSDLYSAIGDKYGSTDTTFNLPNLTGRFIRGNTTAGGTGGSASIQLTVNNIPGHTHSISISTLGSGSHDHSFSTSTPEGGDHLHSITGETGESGSHTHTYRGVNATAGLSENYSAYPIRMYEDKKDNWTGPQIGGGINSAGSHSHSIALNASQGSHSHLVTGDTDTVENHTHEVQGDTGSAGSGEEIDSLPPYIDLVFAIKYSSEISSPVLKVKNEETGEWIGIESIKGTKGDPGADGPAGPYFTPAVSSDGTISWTNNGGLQNPETQNIRGPQGEQGIEGPQGPAGPAGDPGNPGVYLGVTEPTDPEIKVWIDPEGDLVYDFSHGKNYLINSYFINPINQRGATTYSSNYSIDRWRCGNSSTLSIVSGGVTVTGYVTQYIELPDSVIGKSFVCSAEDSSGNIRTMTGTLSTSKTRNNYFVVNYDTTNSVVYFALLAGTWKWVKFEFGEYPTEYEIPMISDEYLRCCRYYFIVDSRITGNAAARIFPTYGWWARTVSLRMYLPNQMRDIPSVTHSGGGYIANPYGNGVTGRNIDDTSAISARGMSGNGIDITVPVTGSDIGPTTWTNWMLVINDDGYLEFDAEIYA